MTLDKVAKTPLRTAVGKVNICRCKKRHEHHICELRAKGRTHEIIKMIQKPGFACGICGETADSADNICSPVPLFI